MFGNRQPARAFVLQQVIRRVVRRRLATSAAEFLPGEA